MLYDKDIREALFDYTDELYPINRILQEMNIGDSRADALLITPEVIVGIEIKSDADTYARLSKQTKDYDAYCDYNYIVVGSSHAYHVEEHVPAHWGIITVDEVDGRPDFYLLKKPKLNPNVKIENQILFLWRPEIANIQEKKEMPVYKRQSKMFVREKVLERIEHTELKRLICAELMERDYSIIFEKINEFRKENGAKPRRRRKKLRKY